eukprot:sb/3476323/
MSHPSSTTDSSRAEDKKDDIIPGNYIPENWSDWSDDEDDAEYNRELWNSFDNEIPHVHTFLHQQQIRDDIASANERFNSFYNELVVLSASNCAPQCVLIISFIESTKRVVAFRMDGHF